MPGALGSGEQDLGVPTERSDMVAPKDFRKRILATVAGDLEDLITTTRAHNRDPTAARRMVRRLQEGVDIREAAAIVKQLIVGGDGMTHQNNGGAPALSLDQTLKGIDARRSAIGGELEALAKQKADLKAEEKQLNQAARALRRITGAKNQVFNCNVCELPFDTRNGLAIHQARAHGKKGARNRPRARAGTK